MRDLWRTRNALVVLAWIVEGLHLSTPNAVGASLIAMEQRRSWLTRKTRRHTVLPALQAYFHIWYARCLLLRFSVQVCVYPSGKGHSIELVSAGGQRYIKHDFHAHMP
jgi:hypothetical protein